MKNRTEQNKNNFLSKQSILLCVVGTVFEWYDFSIFACLLPILSNVLFLKENSNGALINIFLIFSIGFIIRPLGALFFGHIGDRWGRKKTLLFTIILMTISTTLIGIIPTKFFNSATIIWVFVFCRVLQGFAASGEYPGSITMLFEIAPINRKGLITSLGIFSAICGTMVGSFVCMLISLFTTHSQMIAWGWRLPFLIGMPLGILGLLFRYKTAETHCFDKVRKNQQLSRIPSVEIIKDRQGPFFKMIGLYILASVGFYINFAYISSYLVSISKITSNEAFFINFLTNLVCILIIPIFGWLSDHYNRHKLIKLASFLLVIASYPIFFLLFNYDKVGVYAGQITLAALLGMFVGPLGAFTGEMFSTPVRYSGVALVLNLPNAIFGGLTPVICAYLVQWLDDSVAASYYLLFASLIAFISTNAMETLHKTNATGIRYLEAR